jgi:hypothetical protein
MALSVIAGERRDKGSHGLGGHGIKRCKGSHGEDSGAFRGAAEVLSEKSRGDSGSADKIRKEIGPFFHREGLSGEINDKDSLKGLHFGDPSFFVRARTW